MENLATTKLTMTSVYDSKVKQFGQLMPVRTTEEAIRSFGKACREEGHDFKNFSSDYTLWILGYYYPETGVLETVNKIQVSSASDFN